MVGGGLLTAHAYDCGDGDQHEHLHLSDAGFGLGGAGQLKRLIVVGMDQRILIGWCRSTDCGFEPPTYL